MMKKIKIESRGAKRFKPEPEDVESALFFKNEITVKFPCDSVEREVIDLSKSGLKVYVEDNDPLIDQIGKNLKIILSLKEDIISLVVSVVHQTDDEYGLQYLGCSFVNISKEKSDKIVEYLTRVTK